MSVCFIYYSWFPLFYLFPLLCFCNLTSFSHRTNDYLLPLRQIMYLFASIVRSLIHVGKENVFWLHKLGKVQSLYVCVLCVCSDTTGCVCVCFMCVFMVGKITNVVTDPPVSLCSPHLFFFLLLFLIWREQSLSLLDYIHTKLANFENIYYVRKQHKVVFVKISVHTKIPERS